jgi:N6-L-threonylcarbamoyladenine synthase
MSQDCFLALDTSCYTTSYALAADGEVLRDARKMLDVPQGARGLRQSEAVFQHVRNFEQLFSIFSREGYEIRAVGYSEKPCPRDDSYMPVFCVGKSFALSFAATLGVPAYALTHQHGHIYAGFFGNTIADGELAVLHVSGGTLDILRASIREGIVEHIAPLSSASDITCGQFIDRVGVAIGLAFPAGREMERMYALGGVKLAVHVDGLSANLSGAETQALRLLKAGGDPAQVCSGAIDCVAETLEKLVINAAQIAGLKRFLLTGGVICNEVIRQRLMAACAKTGVDAAFAQKKYCGDNACGLALAAQRMYRRGHDMITTRGAAGAHV